LNHLAKKNLGLKSLQLGPLDIWLELFLFTMQIYYFSVSIAFFKGTSRPEPLLLPVSERIGVIMGIAPCMAFERRADLDS
jgi:hypothetical protein